MKHCKLCNTEKPLDCFHLDKNRPNGHYPTCKTCFSTVHKQMDKKFKKECFEAYGGKCVCCGEAEFSFLSIDHVDNNGSEHRKANGIKTGRSTYNWLRRNKYPEGYQVLCHNCNLGKFINKGICPHQQAA